MKRFLSVHLLILNITTTTKPYPKFNDISTSKLLQFIDAYGQLFVPPAM